MNNKKKISLFSFFSISLSVVLFFLAHPNPLVNDGIGWLGWIYFFPIAACIRQNDYGHSAFWGFIYGFFSYSAYGYWLVSYSLFFLFCVGIFYGILWLFLALLLKYINRIFSENSWFVQGICITIFEYLKTKGFAGFSYGITGYTQWKLPVLIQISDITGVYGLSLIMILCSFLLEKIIYDFIQNKIYFLKENNTKSDVGNIIKNTVNNKNNKTEYIIFLSLTFMYLIFVVIYGNIRMNIDTETKTVGMVAIQSNDDPWADGIENYRKNIQEMIYLTDEALEFHENAQIVIWPETAVVPSVMNYYSEQDGKRKRLIEALMKYLNSKSCNFVIGNAYSSISDKKDYNSSLYFKAGSNILPPCPEIYSKIKLVPFSEYFPYKKIFPWIYRYLSNTGNHFWEPGNEIKIFECSDFHFGTPICFEDTFPDIPRKMRLKGAQGLLNLSNDSWSASIGCQKQHLSMAVFRAAENKIPEIRSTATGQTCYIDMNGRVVKEVLPFCRSSLYCEAEYPVESKLTIYTKYGDIFIWAVIFVFVILLLKQIFIVIIKK